MRYFKTAIVLLLPLLIADPHGRAHGQYLNREQYPLWATEGYEN